MGLTKSLFSAAKSHMLLPIILEEQVKSLSWTNWLRQGNKHTRVIETQSQCLGRLQPCVDSSMDALKEMEETHNKMLEKKPLGQ